MVPLAFSGAGDARKTQNFQGQGMQDRLRVQQSMAPPKMEFRGNVFEAFSSVFGKKFFFLLALTFPQCQELSLGQPILLQDCHGGTMSGRCTRLSLWYPPLNFLV